MLEKWSAGEDCSLTGSARSVSRRSNSSSEMDSVSMTAILREVSGLGSLDIEYGLEYDLEGVHSIAQGR